MSYSWKMPSWAQSKWFVWFSPSICVLHLQWFGGKQSRCRDPLEVCWAVPPANKHRNILQQWQHNEVCPCKACWGFPFSRISAVPGALVRFWQVFKITSRWQTRWPGPQAVTCDYAVNSCGTIIKRKSSPLICWIWYNKLDLPTARLPNQKSLFTEVEELVSKAFNIAHSRSKPFLMSFSFNYPVSVNTDTCTQRGTWQTMQSVLPHLPAGVHYSVPTDSLLSTCDNFVAGAHACNQNSCFYERQAGRPS